MGSGQSTSKPASKPKKNPFEDNDEAVEVPTPRPSHLTKLKSFFEPKKKAVAEDEEGEYGGIPYTGIDPEQLREAEDRVQKLEMQLDEMQSALTSKTVHSSQIQKENEELKEHIKLFEEQKLELTAELDTVKSEPTGGMYSLQDAEDVVIVSNHIGRNMAEQLQKYLHRSCAGWATGVVNCSTHGLEEVERRAVCARVAVVVVLSLGALQDAGCVLALALSEAETHYGYPHNQRILIIHQVEGFPFPPYEQLPKAPSGEVVKAFDQPAVPYISMHSETGFKQITHRLCDRGAASAAPGSPREVLAESGRGGQLPSKALPELGESAFAAYAVLQEVVPPVHLQMCQKKTRVMWSFKHASAQRDVNRLHQVLQRKFVVWLEPGDMDLVEGGREAHYRKLIYRTKQAHTLLVYLTFGFLESQACMLQLITAVAHAMHIVWARDFMFQLPDDVDMEGSAVHALLQRILAEHSGEFLDHADLEMRVLEVLRSNSGSCLIFHPDLFDPFMLRLGTDPLPK
ncbi:hypothetical protein CYMTET_15270 [Cymbomonas tetramitiformis]|uniref:TIR domain-containing protein n=1 Tax=Cymbomonas tetramitiformis TaxID=36881 RepID=A0AAE0L969_9CHLO|nr:hypothetical protein CYMTET_15270 [Cymbomonas tetramitiformis]